MLRTLRLITDNYIKRNQQYNQFISKVDLYIDCGPYLIKTAGTRAEILAAFRLRYHVFHREMLGKVSPEGVDTDRFDALCDHLIIVDKETSEVIGTYRLTCSTYNRDFYSATEFEISDLLKEQGPLLELGRACIKDGYRRGSIISLLWKGIGAYMERVNAQILFGCASVQSQDLMEIANLYRLFLEKNYVSSTIQTRPLSAFEMPGLIETLENRSLKLSDEERKQSAKFIPPLLLSYFRLGAQITGLPVYDPEFRCVDFLTFLRRENLSSVVARKYQVVKNS